MKSILIVTVPAASQDLTTLAAVKSELGITDDLSNIKLTSYIGQASGIVADYCQRSFGEETLSETFRVDCVGGPLILSRHPVASITSINENSAALVATDYELDPAAGFLYRISNDRWSMWRGGKIVVVYIAGYALIDSLPQSIERACIELVKGYWLAGNRDATLKRLSITTPGVETIDQEFSVDTMNGLGLPREVADLLAPYREFYV